MARCNICGNRFFGPGPGGRRSFDGKSMPRCTRCQSLERHRALRSFWLGLPKDFLATKDVLQFSTDRSVDKKWFKDFEVSIYGGENSIDVQDIKRPDHSYDIINCVHVLEHIPDDRKALREMLRVVKPDGFIVLAVPSPLQLERTNDWGYPDEKQHGHFRIYGQDITNMLDDVVGKENYVQIMLKDPVTGSSDCVFVLSTNARIVSDIAQRVEHKSFLQKVFSL